MKTYWYIGEHGRNFGDVLSPVLLAKAGITPEWVPANEARLFAIGSNLEVIPRGFDGIVLGTGMLRAGTRRDLRRADVLAMRGHLSAAAAGVAPRVLADLGLLASDLLDDRPEQDIDHGVIRHFGDKRRLRGHRIDVLAGVMHVIREAARCRRISASSLHGIVLADALGIPNRWLPHPAATPLKFVDYASAFGEDIVPGTWRLADQSAIATKQAALRDLLSEVTEPSAVAA